MGCSSNDYIDNESNQKADYLTKVIYESIIERKKAKDQAEHDKEQEEAERLEKEYLRQQHLLDSLDTRGPKSYVDNLITVEIPKMKFGIIASEEEIVKDLNDRDCEEYKEGEVDESEEKIDIEEIKKEEEKNKNEIDELKKQIEEMNKKEEEEKNNNKNKKRKKKGGGKGFFDKNQENEDENQEKENKINEKEEENELNKEKEKSGNEEKNEIEDKGELKEGKSSNEINSNLEEEDKEKVDKKGKRNKKKKKTKNEEQLKEKEENSNIESKGRNEEKKNTKKKTKKKTKKNDKMKELMELKIEKPPYADQIKRYKYPKKNEQSEKQLIFSSLPSELIICIIGDEKSGKTSFIRKYISNKFEETYQKTEKIENDEIETEIDSKKIKLIILDTPPLTIRKNIKIIQEEAINKSHIIIYIFDINDEHAEFKVRLMSQSFEFNEKHIIVIIGNKTDKISIYSSKNKDFIKDYCYIKKFIFTTISCADTTKEEIENFVNDKIINEYLTLYKE